MRRLLDGSAIWDPASSRNLQDPLSFRNLPQILGALRDALAHVDGQLAIELDASQGNPIVVLDERRVVSVANFEILPLAAALDYLRIVLASALGAAAERVVKMLETPWSGLPTGLSPSADRTDPGLSYLGIAVQSLAAEARLLAAPVSFELVSTAHAEGIEDRTSLAPLAARRLDEMVGLGARIVAIELTVAAQAAELRGTRTTRNGDRGDRRGRSRLRAVPRDRRRRPGRGAVVRGRAPRRALALMPATVTARDRPPEEAAEDTSFARGLRLLLTIADRGEVRADELGGALDMPVSTVYRYLRTLAEFGFVERRGGGYRLGPRLLIGDGANVSSERLIRHAGPVLQRLAAETGETAIVVRRIGLSSVCLHQVESEAPLRVTLDPGAPTPLYAGAPGRVLLAFAPAPVLEAVLAEDLVRLTRRTPTETELRAGLGDIVMTGMATSEGELIEGSVAIAAPVFREDGIVGALGLIGPAIRCRPAWRARAGRLLQDAARSVNEALAD